MLLLYDTWKWRLPVSQSFLEQRVWNLVSPISTHVGDDQGLYSRLEREREGPFVTSEGTFWLYLSWEIYFISTRTRS